MLKNVEQKICLFITLLTCIANMALLVHCTVYSRRHKMSPRVILYILYMVCFLSCSHLWHFHFLLISVGYDLNLMIKASTCLYTPTINANSRNWSLMISRKIEKSSKFRIVLIDELKMTSQ